MTATQLRADRSPIVITLAAGAVMLLVVRIGNPTTDRWFPPCPFKALTGLNCPGCGSTRALHAIARGDLAAAFTFNPLLLVALPFLTYAYLAWAVRGLTGRQLPVRALPASVSWIVLVVMIGFAVARNLPFMLVAWMAP